VESPAGAADPGPEDTPMVRENQESQEGHASGDRVHPAFLRMNSKAPALEKLADSIAPPK
jgi:hypothetical protein